MPISFVPNTEAPTHLGNFRASPQLGLTGRPGGPLLPDVFPAGRQVLRAAFGADPKGDRSAWQFTDITTAALWDDGLNVKIGYENEARELTPANLVAVLRNDQAGGGDFTVDNAYGAHWPNVVQDVPIEFIVDIGNGESLVFQGYATSWKPRWDSGNRDATVTLTAHGVHRRIKQGDDVAKSAMRRVFDAAVAAGAGPVAYWSLEDDSDATTAASCLAGGAPMVASGGSTSSAGVRFGVAQGRMQAAYTGYEISRMGCKSFVSLGDGGTLSASLPSGTATMWRVQVVVRSWCDGSDIVLVRWLTPGGSFDRYEIKQINATQELQLIGYSGTSATVLATTNPFSALDENELVVLVTQNGSNVDTVFNISRPTSTDLLGFYLTDTRAGTVRPPSWIGLNPDKKAVAHTPISGSENLTNDLTFAHLAVWHTEVAYTTDGHTDPNTGIFATPWTGWAGEPVTRRLARLADEQRVAMDIVGSSDAVMGFQDTAKFSDLILDPSAVDLGMLVDGLGWGYTYYTRDAGTSQGAALVLDSSGAPGGDILGPNAPEHDDLERVTDYTATNPGVASARYAIPNPAGGIYEDGGDHRAHFAADLTQIAAYKVGAGTARGLRWPQVRFQLAKASTSARAQAWLNCRPLSRIDTLGISQGSNPDRSMSLRGWRLRINSKIFDVAANLAPYDPYAVTTLARDTGDTSYFLGWLDVDVVTTAVDLAAGGTSVACVVIGTALTNPSVSTYADDIDGLYINLDGMQVGVTGISAPSGGTQTISVNGADVVRRVPAGARVSAWNPVVLGL